MEEDLEEKIHFKKRRHYIFVLLSVSLFIFTVGLCSISMVQVSDIVTCHGLVESRERTEILAPQAGIVTEIHTEVGQYVEAGDALMTLHSHTLEDRLFEIENQLMEARAQLQLKESDYKVAQINALPKDLWAVEQDVKREAKRLEHMEYQKAFTQSLFEKKHASPFELKKAELDYQVAQSTFEKTRFREALLNNGLELALQEKAQSAVNLAKARVSTLERSRQHVLKKIEACTLRAPATGMVALITPSQDEAVAQFKHMVRLVYGEDQHITAHVSDEEIQEIRIGQEVLCYSAHYDPLKVDPLVGVVEQIDTEIDSDVEGQQYPITIAVKDRHYPLALSSSMKLKVFTGKRTFIEALLGID